MDVAVWLRGLGLGQYESAFRENHVDAGLLSSLTIDDLKEIGIASLGHRGRILDAIAILRAPATLAETPTLLAGAMPSKPARAGGRAEANQSSCVSSRPPKPRWSTVGGFASPQPE